MKVRVKKAKAPKEPTSEAVEDGAREEGAAGEDGPREEGAATNLQEGATNKSAPKQKRPTSKTPAMGDASQGGIFTKKKKTTSAKNTVHGIEAEDFGDGRSAPVTSLRKLEVARKAKQDNRKKFAQAAAWKI